MGQVKGQLAVGTAEAEASAAARLLWVDNLKMAVIAGVVVVHTAMAYLIDADWGTVALSRNVLAKPSKVEALLHGRAPRKGRTTRPCP
jgi:uncharacterized membrane protein YcfT